MANSMEMACVSQGFNYSTDSSNQLMAPPQGGNLQLYKQYSKNANRTLTTFAMEMSEILRQSIQRLDNISLKVRSCVYDIENQQNKLAMSVPNSDKIEDENPLVAVIEFKSNEEENELQHAKVSLEAFRQSFTQPAPKKQTHSNAAKKRKEVPQSEPVETKLEKRNEPKPPSDGDCYRAHRGTEMSKKLPPPTVRSKLNISEIKKRSSMGLNSSETHCNRRCSTAPTDKRTLAKRPSSVISFTTSSKKASKKNINSNTNMSEEAVMHHIRQQHKQLVAGKAQDDYKKQLMDAQDVDPTLEMLRNKYTDRPRRRVRRKREIPSTDIFLPRSLRSKQSQKVNDCYTNEKFEDNLWFGPKLCATVSGKLGTKLSGKLSTKICGKLSTTSSRKTVRNTKLARKYANENFHDNATKERVLPSNDLFGEKLKFNSDSKQDWCIMMQTQKTTPKYELKQNSPFAANNILDEVTLKDLEPLKAEYPRKDHLLEPELEIEETLLYKLVTQDNIRSLEYLVNVDSTIGVDPEQHKKVRKHSTVPPIMPTSRYIEDIAEEDCPEQFPIEMSESAETKMTGKDAKKRLKKYLVDPKKTHKRRYVVMPVLVQFDKEITPHLYYDKKDSSQNLEKRPKSIYTNASEFLKPYIYENPCGIAAAGAAGVATYAPDVNTYAPGNGYVPIKNEPTVMAMTVTKTHVELPEKTSSVRVQRFSSHSKSFIQPPIDNVPRLNCNEKTFLVQKVINVKSPSGSAKYEKRTTTQQLWNNKYKKADSQQLVSFIVNSENKQILESMGSSVSRCSSTSRRSSIRSPKRASRAKRANDDGNKSLGAEIENIEEELSVAIASPIKHPKMIAKIEKQMQQVMTKMHLECPINTENMDHPLSPQMVHRSKTTIDKVKIAPKHSDPCLENLPPSPKRVLAALSQKIPPHTQKEVTKKILSKWNVLEHPSTTDSVRSKDTAKRNTRAKEITKKCAKINSKKSIVSVEIKEARKIDDMGAILENTEIKINEVKRKLKEIRNGVRKQAMKKETLPKISDSGDDVSSSMEHKDTSSSVMEETDSLEKDEKQYEAANENEAHKANVSNHMSIASEKEQPKRKATPPMRSQSENKVETKESAKDIRKTEARKTISHKNLYRKFNSMGNPRPHTSDCNPKQIGDNDRYMYVNHNIEALEKQLGEETKKFCHEVDEVIKQIQESKSENYSIKSARTYTSLLDADVSEEFLTPFMSAVKQYRTEVKSSSFLDYLDGLSRVRYATMKHLVQLKHRTKSRNQTKYYALYIGGPTCELRRWTDSELNVHKSKVNIVDAVVQTFYTKHRVSITTLADELVYAPIYMLESKRRQRSQQSSRTTTSSDDKEIIVIRGAHDKQRDHSENNSEESFRGKQIVPHLARYDRFLKFFYGAIFATIFAGLNLRYTCS